jgi:hypothetical protein
MSWLKKIGGVLASILGIAQKVEPTIVGFTEALLPQFAPFIASADTIFQNIVKEIVTAEVAAVAANQTTGGGAQKLAAVLANVGPSLDNWIQSNFPGSAALATATKAGLVNAVVAVLNDIKPSTAVPAPAPTAPVAPPAA